MSTPSELYRNAIDLNRFSNGVARKIASTYNDVIVQAVAELKGLDDYSPSAKATRLRAILAQMKGSLDNWAAASTSTMIEEMQGLAELQGDFVAKQLEQALPDDFALQVKNVQISPQFAQSVATVDPTAINVVSLSDDLQAAVSGSPQTFSLTAAKGTTITLPNGKVLEKSFRGLAESQADLFSMKIRNGLILGESPAEIASRLKGKLRFGEPGSLRQLAKKGGEATSMANHQVMALVRTSLNQVANEASQQVYKANQDITKSYRYVSTLDNRTSPICRSLDGQEFKYGKGPTPPQHFSCRSTTVPVIDYEGLGIEPPPRSDLRRPNTSFGPSRTKKQDTVPENQSYGEWLSKRPVGERRKILGGEQQAKYFDKLSEKLGPTEAIRRFVREDGKEVSLDYLREQYGTLDKFKVKVPKAKTKPKPKPKLAATPKPKAAVKTKAKPAPKAAPSPKTQALKEKLAASKAKTAATKKELSKTAPKVDATKKKLSSTELLAAKQKEFKQLNYELLTAGKGKDLKNVYAKAEKVKSEIEELKKNDPALVALEKKKKALDAEQAKADKLLQKSRAAIKRYTGEEYREIRAEQFREAQQAGEKLTGFEKAQTSLYKKNRRFAKRCCRH